MGHDVVEVSSRGAGTSLQTVHTPGLTLQVGGTERPPLWGAIERANGGERASAFALSGVLRTVAARDTDSATWMEAQPDGSVRHT